MIAKHPGDDLKDLRRVAVTLDLRIVFPTAGHLIDISPFIELFLRYQKIEAFHVLITLSPLDTNAFTADGHFKEAVRDAFMECKQPQIYFPACSRRSFQRRA